MMKATKRIGSLAVAGVWLGAVLPSLAQNSDRPDRPDRAPAGLLAVLDRNGNGKIDAEEIDLAVASLRKLDKNKDGQITREEIGGAGASRPGRPESGARQPLFGSLDKDGDGKISKEEAPERMKERFDRMDLNSDGFIDEEEQKALLRRIRSGQRPNQPRRTDRRRDGDGDGDGGSDKPKRPEVKKDEE